jgi:hypothetical protein
MRTIITIFPRFAVSQWQYRGSPETKERISICAILTLALLTALVACGAGDDHDANDPAAQVTELADSFMGDMHVGAWHAAYSRLYPGLQAQCGSAENLAIVVQASGERPAAWTLREPNLRKRSGIITGQVETAEGRSGIVELSVEKSGDDWVIVAWSASNRELCQSG